MFDSWCTEKVGNRTNAKFTKVSQNFNLEILQCLCVNVQPHTFLMHILLRIKDFIVQRNSLTYLP